MFNERYNFFERGMPHFLIKKELFTTWGVYAEGDL